MLSAVEIAPAAAAARRGGAGKASTQRWLLWLNPNGMTYEESLPYLSKCAWHALPLPLQVCVACVMLITLSGLIRPDRLPALHDATRPSRGRSVALPVLTPASHAAVC